MSRRTTLVALVAVASLGLGACSDNIAAPSDAGRPLEAVTPNRSSTSVSPAPASPTAGPSRTGSPTTTTTATPAVKSRALGAPKSLSIAGDTSPVVPVGTDALRNLEIPRNIGTLGWWQAGAAPGASHGFVVITGHATRSGTGAANAWWYADPGDTVRLTTKHGDVTYGVVSRTTYRKESIPLARWFPSGGPAGAPGLALITCSDYRNGEWRANTVVEAVPIHVD